MYMRNGGCVSRSVDPIGMVKDVVIREYGNKHMCEELHLQVRSRT